MPKECENNNKKGKKFAEEEDVVDFDLKNLFRNIAPRLLGLEKYNVGTMKRFEENAKFVTATSKKPDLSSLIGNLDLKIGECKHGPKYSKTSAAARGFSYLHAFIYWLRIACERGLRFGICGHKCRGRARSPGKKKNGHHPGTYSVGLFKLTAPQTLGGVYSAKQYWITSNTDSADGLKLLVKFLKYGNTSDLATPPVTTMLQNENARAPCLYALPRSLWADRRLVRNNGTPAIVFRLTRDELLKRVLAISLPDDEHTIEALEWIDKQQPSTDSSFFLKVRTEDISPDFHPLAFVAKYGRIHDDDFRATYPVKPLCDNKFIAVIMNDRGERISPDNLNAFSTPDLLASFGEFKNRVENVDKRWKHGDALYHNLTLTTRSSSDGMLPVFHLIDYDEGAIPGNIPKRKKPDAGDGSNNNWFWDLRYPNVLRLETTGSRYTRVQLAATLIRIFGERDIIEPEYRQPFASLTKAAQAVGEMLADGGEDADLGALPALDALLDSLEKAVNAFLNSA